MNLFTFALVGSIAALLMMAAGFIWLGIRRELQVSRMDPDQAADFVASDSKGRGGRAWFRGLAGGISLYGEKPTGEIIALLAAGRWREGLPWAIPGLGAIAAFFFWPLLIGLLLDLEPLPLWLMVAVFTIGGFYAAWPRKRQ